MELPPQPHQNSVCTPPGHHVIPSVSFALKAAHVGVALLAPSKAAAKLAANGRGRGGGRGGRCANWAQVIL